jgi:hypothetical protein
MEHDSSVLALFVYKRLSRHRPPTPISISQRPTAITLFLVTSGHMAQFLSRQRKSNTTPTFFMSKEHTTHKIPQSYLQELQTQDPNGWVVTRLEPVLDAYWEEFSPEEQSALLAMAEHHAGLVEFLDANTKIMLRIGNQKLLETKKFLNTNKSFN